MGSLCNYCYKLPFPSLLLLLQINETTVTMKNKNIFTLFGLLALSWTAFGQDTLRISKKDLIPRMSEKNLQIKIAEKNYESAMADYHQSNSLFLPNVNLSHTAMLTTNPLMAFGSKLNQAIVSPEDFNPNVLNHPSQTKNFATKIEVQQPLINLDGLYGRQAAKSKMDAFALQTERTKEYLELEVNKAFMQLQLAYKAVKVLQKAENTGKANLKLVENYFKQGMLQKTDVLNVQVRVNEISNQLQYAKSNVQNASDYLGFLLNDEQSKKVYKPTEEFESEFSVISVNTVLPTNRKDIQALDKSSEAYEKMVMSSKMNLLPRLNAFGSYEMYDDNLFGTNAKGYLVGAQLLWNVFDGYKSIGKLEKTKADYSKAQTETEQYKAKSQMELNQAVRQLSDAENNVKLTQLAFKQAQEAYKIRSNRFAQGLEKTTDLLQSETLQSQKELENLQAIFEYRFTQEYIQFLTK